MPNIGEMYTINKVPIRLYWSSDRAALRITSQSGTWSELGSYRIINKLWTNANGDWLEHDPGPGGIALYGLDGLGWVRDDDNLSASTISAFPPLETTGTSVLRIARQSSDLLHHLEFKIGDTVIRKVDNVTDSYTLTFTQQERNTIHNLLSRTSSANLVANILTFRGGVTVVGSAQSATTTVSVPTSLNPSFTDTPTATVVNPIKGKAWQTVSSVKVATGRIAPSPGAAIDHVNIRVGDHAGIGASFTSPAINKSGDILVEVIATDTRQRTVRWTTTVAFAEYKEPGIDSFTAGRTLNDGIAIGVSGTFTSTVATTVSFTLETKERSANTWTVKQTGDCHTSGNTWGVNGALVGFTKDKAYDLRIRIQDGAGRTAEGYVALGTDALPLSLGKKGIGVGKIVDDNGAHLQVEGDTDITGRYLVNGKPLIHGTVLSMLDETQSAGYRWGGTYDMNTIVQTGFYLVGHGRNCPVGLGFMIVCKFSAVEVGQIIFSLQDNRVFRRRKDNFNVWGAWSS